MTPDRWQEIQDLFHAVLACGDDGQEALLADAGKVDASLRAEVEALLAAHHAAGSFGDRPLVALASEPGRCSHCRSEITDPELSGLCPQCLLRLALGEPNPVLEPLAPGNVFGARYQVIKVLGRGGMGEVVHAFDMKLRVDVALKAVSADRAGSDQAREQLRREVRAAREVVSSNVCRIFDLIVADGDELVSMEYIDGLTLSDTLRQRGPLTLQETQEIASQFLSGLEAIHRAGLVHRDIKPENIMITRAGRVVIMDFGLANAPGNHLRAGTPGYMPPEQHFGDTLDARADVFAAGVVLAEMLTVGGDGSAAARRSVWLAIRSNPPQLPEGPWRQVLGRAVAADQEARYPSAHELARALEEVTLRLPGLEQRHPYPGLSAFTADDAQYFFGREVETEQVWKKLEHPRLLALVGPSGAGKSSFLRAGLLPTLPASWKAIVATPGNRPFQSLARALAPALSGDAAAVEQLLMFEDADVALSLFNGLRREQDILLVLDQFEELFTLNPADVQASFASLLGRLVIDADLRVILSLRDDFLLRCQEHEGLRAVFSDLMPLGALSRSALRRALVQPALACGYRFEEEALVDEMVGAVSAERGALPLLAFAASSLWEQRDRDRGLLTREAYQAIGGVAGALAQHAERTLERIGRHRTPTVRELFRNLMTSQGTRAVREREELLSVFDRGHAGVGSRAEAEEVLGALIDARLLTSYERVSDNGAGQRQVEIIHESLLAAWPQLVQWRAQDAEGAQIRDQLRQASQLWDDRGRPNDLLWSGTAYRDFSVWRERYPGSLSAMEEAFAKAATDRWERGRRRRRVLTATMVTAIAAIALLTSGLWRRSETLRGQAVAETQRAEAGKLFAMAERELDRYPTAALAYATRGLELADSQAGRLLALRILQRSQVARVARVVDSERPARPGQGAFDISFSPTSEWLAWAGNLKAELLARDGRTGPALHSAYQGGGRTMTLAFGPRDEWLVTSRSGDVRVLSLPGGQEQKAAHIDQGRGSIIRVGQDSFLTVTAVGDQQIVRAWPMPHGAPRLLGALDGVRLLDATDRTLAYVQAGALYVRSLTDWGAPPRLVARAPGVIQLALSPDGNHVATGDGSNDVRVWPTTGRAERPVRILRSPGATTGVAYDPNARWIVTESFEAGHPMLALFDLQAPWDAQPRVIRKGDTSSLGRVAFDPMGRWLVTAHGTDMAFWPLDAGGQVLRNPSVGAVPSVVFSPDGAQLFGLSLDHKVWSWPMHGGDASIVAAAGSSADPWQWMSRDEAGRQIAVSGNRGQLAVVRVGDPAIRALRGFPESVYVGTAAFGDGGRLVAAGARFGPPNERLIRVWDLDTDVVRTFGPWSPGDLLQGSISSVEFAGRDRLIASVRGVGIISVDLVTAESHVLVPQFLGDIVVSTNHRFAVGAAQNLSSSAELEQSRLFRLDLQTGVVQELPAHGGNVTALALDPTNSVVATASLDGVIRIGPIADEEPHLLLGQEGEGSILSLAFSPDGRWLAASGESYMIHVWPVPRLDERPLHQGTSDEFLSLLRDHTNLRAIADPASAYGYKLEPGPFSGWATLPRR